MKRNKNDYGRLVPKPHTETEDPNIEDHLDDVIPIQDQLDALLIKIHLKELYNHVLKDEFEETKQGADSVLKDLHSETKHLRKELLEALNAEKNAVQKALRSHREFQLAMTGRSASIAIPWLEDKVFDISKRLNIYVHSLAQKRKKLEIAEELVDQIERWPRPGTMPWEIKAVTAFTSYESRIEHMKVKAETANILRAKYTQISHSLGEERGKYYPIIAAIDEQARSFNRELEDLQKSLAFATAFRDSAIKNLAMTQKEASENRRRRRIQMIKMKSAVRRVLDTQNKSVAQKQEGAGNSLRFNSKRSTLLNDQSIGTIVTVEMIRYKRGEIEKYQDRSARLMDAMRVKDLAQVPIRYQCVMSLGERLSLELESKEDLLEALIHQKAQLYIILAHFTYTGHGAAQEFEAHRHHFEEGIEGLRQNTKQLEKKLNKVGEVIIKIRIGSLRILEQLEGRGKKGQRLASDPHYTLNHIQDRVKTLKTKNDELKALFSNKEAGRNYGAFVREPLVPHRLYRVGSAGSGGKESGDSDGDDDIVDLKVPGRLDMKARSLRFIQQARLRKGLR